MQTLCQCSLYPQQAQKLSCSWEGRLYGTGRRILDMLNNLFHFNFSSRLAYYWQSFKREKGHLLHPPFLSMCTLLEPGLLIERKISEMMKFRNINVANRINIILFLAEAKRIYKQLLSIFVILSHKIASKHQHFLFLLVDIFLHLQWFIIRDSLSSY